MSNNAKLAADAAERAAVLADRAKRAADRAKLAAQRAANAEAAYVKAVSNAQWWAEQVGPSHG
jgi:hypothetical protein